MKLSTVRILEGLPGITGGGSQLIRLDPDLEKMSLLLPGRIEFARADPSAGGHVLPITGLDDTAISYRVLVFQLPAQEILINPWDRLQSRREILFLAKARGATPARGKSSPALRVEPVVYPTDLLVSLPAWNISPNAEKFLVGKSQLSSGNGLTFLIVDDEPRYHIIGFTNFTYFLKPWPSPSELSPDSRCNFCTVTLLTSCNLQHYPDLLR